MTARKVKNDENDEQVSPDAPANDPADVPTEVAPVDEDPEDDVEYGYDNGIEGALGTVQERDAYGEGFDVPWMYLTPETVAEAVEDTEPVRTSDWDDPGRSWTVQSRVDSDDADSAPVAYVETQREPGQTFRVAELPSVESLKAAGINTSQFLSGLPVRADVDDEAPRRGVPA